MTTSGIPQPPREAPAAALTRLQAPDLVYALDVATRKIGHDGGTSARVQGELRLAWVELRERLDPIANERPR